MDNYYVDKPLWRVDLGTKNTINGAVILTWQGAGQGMFNFTIRGRQYFLLKNGLLVSAPQFDQLMYSFYISTPT